MTTARTKIAAAILALPLTSVLAQAAPKDTEAKILALQHQLEELQAQIVELKQTQVDQQQTAQKQLAEIEDRTAKAEQSVKSQAKVSVANGRPTFTSADGSFSAALRVVGQADMGHYMQGGRAKSLPAANGADLSSGINMRRVELGLQGKIFDDWSYMFMYEFGGTGSEGPSTVLYSYLQYDGFGPWHVSLGILRPPTNLDDTTSGSQLMFLERNGPANVQRGIAGAEGRSGVSISYTGKRLFGALSLTGDKFSTSGDYDEQMAVTVRGAGLVHADQENDTHLLIGGTLVHVFKVADAAPNSSAANVFRLSDYPEITVDASKSKLIDTGSLSADSVTSYAFEAAGNWKNFYLQGGYFGFAIDRAPVTYNVYSAAGVYAPQTVQPGNNHFEGWYVQGAWTLTGESRKYVPSAGVFAPPNPAHPFSLSKGEWGAWEVAARYSTLNLNDNTDSTTKLVTGWTSSAKTYNWYDSVHGGEQKIMTLGLNWYPNNSLRFMLNYLMADVARVSPTTSAGVSAAAPDLPATGLGQSFQAVVLRAQVAY